MKGSQTTERLVESLYGLYRASFLAIGDLPVGRPFKATDKSTQTIWRSTVENCVAIGLPLSGEEVHDRWRDLMILNGWHYSDEYNKRSKAHPLLVHWKHLTNEQRAMFGLAAKHIEHFKEESK